ncbi:hypothetical protein KC19_3G086600 [Ceratodon purpureus]|uniref:Uncharacterized protein n=1 Tax=Ceratodon purpureus TaxID=3225 RepID=A0A8T0IIU0_CERPU|nr:hypothetical protein KC19_3G086600 [Ceratodon purpureus]
MSLCAAMLLCLPNTCCWKQTAKLTLLLQMSMQGCTRTSST